MATVYYLVLGSAGEYGGWGAVVLHSIQLTHRALALEILVDFLAQQVFLLQIDN